MRDLKLIELDRADHEISRLREKINSAVRGLDRLVAMANDSGVEDLAREIQTNLRGCRD